MGNLQVGKSGEDAATRYLRQKGYLILGRNILIRPLGEIDILAVAPTNELVFTEVKTLGVAGPNSLQPEDNLSAAKLGKMRKAAIAFLQKNGKRVNLKKGFRLDLVAISVSPEGDQEIRHYSNL